eukprot:TRINITY_DN4083_c0_g1_i1.p1 TRINITY_DN4083_c0_g1~~TRINITY_DN4083_c0_g1_i1.p1  ORF type:complete len:256 (-),score=8.46 TRINITY_DN4083_c0_g1_i1:42-809(-)
MRHILYISLCIYFVSLVSAQDTSAKMCSHLVANDGSVYDLTVLVEKGKYVIKGYDSGIESNFDFSFAVCQNLPKGCGGDGDPICSQDGSAGSCMCFEPCQEWDEWCYGTFSLEPNVQPLDDGKGVVITYNRVGNLGTRVQLLCDYNFAGMDQNNITKNTGTSTFEVMILTDAACPISGGGMSGGTIFLLVVLVVCILYLVVGILINKFSRMKNGREVVPNVEFWTSLPGLVADGAKFSVSKITGRTPRSTYSTVE